MLCHTTVAPLLNNALSKLKALNLAVIEVCSCDDWYLTIVYVLTQLSSLIVCGGCYTLDYWSGGFLGLCLPRYHLQLIVCLILFVTVGVFQYDAILYINVVAR
jgi:hypothetical protein